MITRLWCAPGMVNANWDLWNLPAANRETLSSLAATVAFLLLFPKALLTGDLELHLR